MYAPKQVVSNDELAQRGVDTSDEWIRTRTGIARRHLAGDHETTAQMAIAAAREALKVADADPRDIGLIILATVTPNHTMPSTACQVQDALGAIRAGAFDLNAGCSGFIYGLSLAQQAIASGEHNLVLVIGAETLSRAVNWEDRTTCVLFGDGAGAMLLRATEGPAGIQASIIGSDGSGSNLLIIPAGGSAMPATSDTVAKKLHCIQMNGQEVFRFATTILAQATEQVAAKAGWELEDIALIVPHQANLRIIASASKRLKLPVERFVTNLQEYGNTSAASIPIALCEAAQAGRIGPGQNIVLVGFGAGLTWGATAIKWSVIPGEVVAPGYRNVWRWLLYRWARLRSFSRQGLRRLLVLFIRGADHIGRR